MGLSIHYHGYIKDVSRIPLLTEEVKDICTSLSWKYQCINSDELDGICFAPEKSESIFLTFLKNGRLCSPVSLLYPDMYEANNLDPELQYTTSTKTQFAGRDAHVAIIKLLRYLAGKYFSSFHLQDEGHYWETSDLELLNERFDLYERGLKSFTALLENMPGIPGESAQSLADRIEALLNKQPPPNEA